MTFRLANRAGRAVLLHGDDYHDLEAASSGSFGSDPVAALARVAELHEVMAALGERPAEGAVSPGDLGPPVPTPQKVFGIGLNYRNHAEESGMDLPTTPLVFTKFPSCLTGPSGDVVVVGEHTDWEAELVVVVGTGGRDIPAAEAWDHVAGLTCGQDVSQRRTQMASKPPQFSMGKSYDTFGPIGPAVVSIDSFGDHTDLELTCEVNGEVKQHDRTSDLIFDVPALVEYLSSILTLVPGDMIFTGTPGGVGAASGTFLKPGDVVTTTIEGIGTMRNTCTAG